MHHCLIASVLTSGREVRDSFAFPLNPYVNIVTSTLNSETATLPGPDLKNKGSAIVFSLDLEPNSSLSWPRYQNSGLTSQAW